jgi:hypothetical protein
MMPKIYAQIVDVYGAMLDRSTPGVMPGGPPVYRGFTTHLVEELGYGIPHYTVIMRRLRSMGCIHQLVAGGRSVQSEWELLTEPTPELFSQHTGRQHNKSAELEARVEALEARLDMQEEQAS